MIGDETGTGVVVFGTGPTIDGAANFSGAALLSASPLQFEGATADAFETTLAVTDPTADRVITLPNETGSSLIRKALGNTACTATCGSASCLLGFDGAVAVACADASADECICY